MVFRLLNDHMETWASHSRGFVDPLTLGLAITCSSSLGDRTVTETAGSLSAGLAIGSVVYGRKLRNGPWVSG